MAKISIILIMYTPVLKLPLIIKKKSVDCKQEYLMHIGYQLIFVVYQCTNSNVMVPWGIQQHFSIARVKLCWNVRITPAASWNLSNYHLTLAWIVASLHTLWHSTYKCLSTTQCQVCVWGVCFGVHDNRRGLERSISGCVCQCVTTILHL